MIRQNGVNSFTGKSGDVTGYRCGNKEAGRRTAAFATQSDETEKAGRDFGRAGKAAFPDIPGLICIVEIPIFIAP